jgi:hypothetical protein
MLSFRSPLSLSFHCICVPPTIRCHPAHPKNACSSENHVGQYHWVHCLTPASYRATASWFTGWISIGGQLVLAASAAFAAGLQLQALITLNNPDSYIRTRWQGMLFYWLIIAYSTAINIWGSKILPHSNTAAGKRTSPGTDLSMLLLKINIQVSSMLSGSLLLWQYSVPCRRNILPPTSSQNSQTPVDGPTTGFHGWWDC